nr:MULTISPECIES: Lar family restriction alleviation protein [unclassified Neglectibacter]
MKPCRYCGGRAEIVKERFTYFEPRPLILCHECGLTTREFETVEEAVAYWNN